MSEYRLDYLEQLESESIHIFREVAGQFEKPALLFSGGKDSIVLVHLALKAFRPGKFPFPLVHIDTGHNFPEALKFKTFNRAKGKVCQPKCATDLYFIGCD
jgi:sulfate adenylyltransferase subunit 2